ncbi:MAG: hypothetical protein ACI9J3_002416 [Parvicellaceae bacterium]|jgi:hypothetical protein
MLGTIQAQVSVSPCSVGVVHAHIQQDVGNGNGQIQVDIEESMSTHTFKWSNGETKAHLSKLNEGTYSVKISDQNGCTETKVFFVPGTTLLSETSGLISFDLFPVPTSGKLHVSPTKSFAGKRIRIFDSLGKLVMLKTYTANLNVSRLQAGLYYFEIEDGDRLTGRRKFIKQ